MPYEHDNMSVSPYFKLGDCLEAIPQRIRSDGRCDLRDTAIPLFRAAQKIVSETEAASFDSSGGDLVMHIAAYAYAGLLALAGSCLAAAATIPDTPERDAWEAAVSAYKRVSKEYCAYSMRCGVRTLYFEAVGEPGGSMRVSIREQPPEDENIDRMRDRIDELIEEIRELEPLSASPDHSRLDAALSEFDELSRQYEALVGTNTGSTLHESDYIRDMNPSEWLDYSGMASFEEIRNDGTMPCESSSPEMVHIAGFTLLRTAKWTLAFLDGDDSSHLAETYSKCRPELETALKKLQSLYTAIRS